MSATTSQNQRWLRKWLRFEPHQIIGGKDDPYLLRWYVIPRNRVLNIYLHQFLRSDDDRALHDHPWWFASLILRGRYDEITEDGCNYRSAGSIAFRPAECRHRVELLPALENASSCDAPLQPCWTLIVTGPRRRLWGFWCKYIEDFDFTNTIRERFVPWDQWGDAGCGEPA